LRECQAKFRGHFRLQSQNHIFLWFLLPCFVFSHLPHTQDPFSILFCITIHRWENITTQQTKEPLGFQCEESEHGSNRCQDSRFQFEAGGRAPPLAVAGVLLRLRGGGGAGDHGGEGLRRLPALPVRTDHAQGAPRRRRWHARPPFAAHGSGARYVKLRLKLILLF